jgi:type I restriction enzyme R subunit
MWLTGFDAPSMHTMYVDKPMKGHGLMQAIARVNRVFKDKPSGLVVDYIGIAQNLRNALANYANPQDRANTGIDESLAIAVLKEKYDVVKQMFAPDMASGFDYRLAIRPDSTPQQRLATLAGAIDWILTLQQEASAKETSEDDKKKAHRRFATAMAELSKAFAIASASDEAKAIREEVAFFQAVRSALAKSDASPLQSAGHIDFAIQQLISQAVISTDIVDILKAAGLQSPDISILSDDFLQELQKMEHKNLALEALRKLLNGEIKAQQLSNVAKAKALSKRLQEAIARYHSNAISTVQVLEELIQLAKEYRKAHEEGIELGLTPEEVAFYDALALNDSAQDLMGEPQLRVIAHELVEKLRNSVTVDWAKMESARARLRLLVKGILRKYGYPPDLQDAAVQTVLQQAETLSAQWSVA